MSAQFPVGTRLSKEFDGAKYGGKVVSYEASTRWYMVEYDDGDKEELTASQLTKLAVRTKTKAKTKGPATSKRKRQTAADNTSPRQRTCAAAATEQPLELSQPDAPSTEMKEEQDTPKEQAAAAAPPKPVQKKPKPSARAAPQTPEKSPYELYVKKRKEENARVMAELMDGAAQKLEQTIRATQPKIKERKVFSSIRRVLPVEPPRKSTRATGAPLMTMQDAYDQIDDEEQLLVAKAGRSQNYRLNPNRWEGTEKAESQWRLPQLMDEHGQEVPHRKSCHICTQCVASWRGAFSEPLGCASCPLIWCSRCLSNIFKDMDDIEGFIQRAQGLWRCLVCAGACACQNMPRSLKVMERHKRWGWVGVTGHYDSSCHKPRTIEATTSEELAVAEVKEE